MLVLTAVWTQPPQLQRPRLWEESVQLHTTAQQAHRNHLSAKMEPETC
jgi:hypothetical protein